PFETKEPLHAMIPNSYFSNAAPREASAADLGEASAVDLAMIKSEDRPVNSPIDEVILGDPVEVILGDPVEDIFEDPVELMGGIADIEEVRDEVRDISESAKITSVNFDSFVVKVPVLSLTIQFGS